MINLRNYRAPAFVLLSVAVTYLAINGALSFAVGEFPSSLLKNGEEPTDWSVIERVGTQVSAVEGMWKREPGQFNGKLAVFLGQSTAKDGIDPQIMDTIADSSYRWLGLCGSGGSILKIVELSQFLFGSSLKPQAILLVIGPEMLVGVPNPPMNPVRDLSEVASDLSARNLRKLKQDVNDRMFLSRNRRFVNHWVRTQLYDARMILFHSMGLGVDSWFPPASDPWAVEPLDAPQQRNDEQLKLQAKKYKYFGWLDDESYALDSPNSKAFVKLVDDCRRRSHKVMLVIMPAHSEFRKLIAPEARHKLDEVIALAAGTVELPVIDLWDACTDDMMRDYLHTNVAGREFSSRLLADKLTVLLRPANHTERGNE